MNKNFEKQYREGHMPWDHGTVDVSLPRMLERFSINPCRALDIGCGTGDNAIWLAEQGFDTAGYDLSETAIKMAVAKKGAEACSFLVADFLEHPASRASFGLVFDRGCFHSVKSKSDRRRFVKAVADVLDENGVWISLVGNADEIRKESGPPQMTAREWTALVEPNFEILSLESGYFFGERENPPRAWIGVLRRRG